MGVMTPTTDRVKVRHDTLSGVTSKGTDRKTIRVDPELWESFGAVTAGHKDGRSGDLREYMRWRVAHPDFQLPALPAVDTEEQK
jgi:hypothetical protein